MALTNANLDYKVAVKFNALGENEPFVSATGADELIFLRITSAQMLSFVVVLVVYVNKCRKEKPWQKEVSNV